MQYFSQTVKSITRTLQSWWDLLCPLMGSGEVGDFPHGLGIWEYVCFCLRMFMYSSGCFLCVSVEVGPLEIWKGSQSELAAQKEKSPYQRKTSVIGSQQLPCWR